MIAVFLFAGLPGLLGALAAAQSLPDGRAQRRVVIPTPAELGVQPFALHVERVAEALADLGAPLAAEARAEVARAGASPKDTEHVQRLTALLEPRVLIVLAINPEGRVAPSRGPAAAELDQHDARSFLVRIENAAGTTAPLAITSRQAFEEGAEPGGRWLELRAFVGPFLRRELAGLAREYRIVSLGSPESGQRAATLTFDMRQGEQFAVSPNAIDLLFDVRPAVPVELSLRDEKDGPAIAALVVRDAWGGTHPAQALRSGADFRFQEHVYRGDGERLWLQPGAYSVSVRRGPEVREQRHELVVARPEPGAEAARLALRLERWIDPRAAGWWSGDHHVHASGCQHYMTPGIGVGPEDVLRHTRGEDLKVALCLTWGPGWDYQQQFFTGKQDARSKAPYFLRYDVEISGFGSHRTGHLCLLGLRQQEYRGIPGIVHWPELGLETLRWAKAQGAVTGTAHSGLGLAVESTELPNRIVPPFDSVGANEFVVDVTHTVPGADGASVPAVDFYGVGDTPWPWELNLWYHVLQVGFRTRLAGETDFPCLDDRAVGAGRSYVKLAGEPSAETWIAGLAAGRSYVGDGRSHLIDFRVDSAGVGEGVLALASPATVRVTARAAALLGAEPDPRVAGRSWKETPYWHVERARVPGTRTVEVECVVNGFPIGKRSLAADGELREIAFDVPVERSSWIALRILPSCHTNPVFVEVGAAPVRASRASAEFLLRCVERCWEQKARFYEREEDKAAAVEAYQHAREVYRRLARECPEGS